MNPVKIDGVLTDMMQEGIELAWEMGGKHKFGLRLSSQDFRSYYDYEMFVVKDYEN